MQPPLTFFLLGFLLFSVFVPDNAAGETASKYDPHTLRKISALNRAIKRTKRAIAKVKRKKQNVRSERLKRKLRRHVVVLRVFKGRTILGRWVWQGFEDTTRVEITRTRRFDIYSGDGTFPTLAEFREQNPQLIGNEWCYEGNTVVVDLNFGNYSRLKPRFKCGNQVIDWIDQEGSVHSTFYREGHDISRCN